MNGLTFDTGVLMNCWNCSEVSSNSMSTSSTFGMVENCDDCDNDCVACNAFAKLKPPEVGGAC